MHHAWLERQDTNLGREMGIRPTPVRQFGPTRATAAIGRVVLGDVLFGNRYIFYAVASP